MNQEERRRRAKKVDFFAIRPFPIGTFLWLEFYLSSYLCFSYSAFLQLHRRVCSVWVWVFALKVFLTSKNPPVRLPWPVGSPNFGKSGERRQIRECMWIPKWTSEVAKTTTTSTRRRKKKLLLETQTKTSGGSCCASSGERTPTTASSQQYLIF